MKKVSYILVLIVIGSLLTLSFLGKRGLCEPDEGRYASIAREMLESGDYLTPRLNYIKHFHKPPLAYWMITLSYVSFGMDEFTARLPVALLGIGGMLITFILAKHMGHSNLCSFVSSLILLTSVQYYAWTQILSSDMIFSFFIYLAILGLWFGIIGKDSKMIYLLYAGLSFAFLVKGPVAIILLLFIFLVYTLVTRDYSLFKKLRFARGFIIFIVLTSPWFVYECMVNPGLFKYFIFYQSLSRLLSTTHGRDGSLLYFLPVFLAGFMPWIVFLPNAVRGKIKFSNLKHRLISDSDKPWIFLIIWLIVPFLFFSLSKSQLSGYILPIYPAAAILVGNYLCEKKLFKSFTVIAITTSVIYLIILSIVPKYEERLGSNLSIRKPAEYIIKNMAYDDKIINYKCFLEGLPFYLKRNIVLVDKKRETQFEDKYQKIDSLSPLLLGDQRIWCFTKIKHFNRLLESSLIPLHEVWRSKKYILFTNEINQENIE